MGIKIVLTGDNHLNAYSSKMRPFQIEERRQKLKDNFIKTIEYALKNKADLYLNTGDLFDMPNPRNDSLLTVAEGLNDLKKAGIKAFLIGGSHDTPRNGIIIPQLIFARQDNVNVFYKQDIIENIKLNIRGTDVTVAGITNNPLLSRNANPLKSALSGYSKNNSTINILLLHYAIEGCVAQKTNEPVLQLKTFNDSPFNYIFAGHSHAAKKFYHNDKLFIIPGSTEKLNFSEKKENGFFYLEIDNDKNTRVEFIPLDCQKRNELEINFNSFNNKDDPNTFILNHLIKASDANQLLKINITGNINRRIYQKIKFHNIWNMGEKSNFYFELSRKGLLIIDTEMDIVRASRGRLSQKEEVRKVADNMKRTAKTEAEKEIIEESINLITKRFEEMRDW